MREKLKTLETAVKEENGPAIKESIKSIQAIIKSDHDAYNNEQLAKIVCLIATSENYKDIESLLDDIKQDERANKAETTYINRTKSTIRPRLVELDFPIDLCCPITKKPFQDPVISKKDGKTYEKTAVPENEIKKDDNDRKDKVEKYLKENGVCTFQEFLNAAKDHDFTGLSYTEYHLESRDERLRTPLHIFFRLENFKNNYNEIKSTKAIEFLLDAGADVNARDYRGFTGLHCLALLNKFPKQIYFANLLLKHGANVNSFLTDRFGGKITVLCIATTERNEEMVKLLLENNVDLNCDALYTSCQKGYLKIAELLINRGAKVNINNTVNSCGDTILHAMMRGLLQLTTAGMAISKDMIALLLKHGADPGIKNKKGQTVVDCFFEAKNKDLKTAERDRIILQDIYNLLMKPIDPQKIKEPSILSDTKNHIFSTTKGRDKKPTTNPTIKSKQTKTGKKQLYTPR